MKYTILILFAITIVAFAGCEAQNPVCTDNFCFVGEAFPRSELEAGQEFSEVAIDDSVIFATLITGTTPVATVPAVETPAASTPASVETVSLSDIIADTAAGGKLYEYKLLNIRATVSLDNSLFRTGTVTLVTNNDDVSFFVGNRHNPTAMDKYKEDQTYNFTVFISEIKASTSNTDRTNIWSKHTTKTQCAKRWI